jgi:hypothetical protein
MNHSPVKLTGQQSFCGACRELFKSTAGFDRHRTGSHGVNRRCRTPDEMTERGMSLNAKGYWITACRPTGAFPAGAPAVAA